MNILEPFAYPTTALVRVHGPRGYKDYTDYKPFLRDEFSFRCVYCLERERWYPNWGGSFSADHFVPKVIAPDRETEYDNLVYACVRCNSYKRADVTSLDPAIVPFAEHFLVAGDGRIEGRGPEARELIHTLHLNDGPALATRLGVLRLLRLKERYPTDDDIHALFMGDFGYPDDLPDLARLRPPGGNARPDGIAASHFERRKRGELPEVY